MPILKDSIMDLLLPVLLGIALSMDCFAVSLAIGTSTKSDLTVTALVIALSFGVFQTGMTLAGWAAGSWIAGSIEGFDHWVAFLLLGFIGIRMIAEGFETEEEDEPIRYLRFLPVMMLSIATSIDALGVGFSYAFLGIEIIIPALIIGLVAFLISFGGVMSGMRLRGLLGKKIEIAGGLVLIAIGLNILISHLVSP